MNICSYSFEEYFSLIKSFHGSTAPGIIIGGGMVDIALREMPENTLYDVLCETSACLPDAVQLLTPCTIGNGWLKIVNLGRFALTVYEKYQGRGIRAFLDAKKVKRWPEIESWYLRLKPKKEQDFKLLLAQIREAGTTICSLQEVTVSPQFRAKPKQNKAVTICPGCGEAFPAQTERFCEACRGHSPYLSFDFTNETTRQTAFS